MMRRAVRHVLLLALLTAVVALGCSGSHNSSPTETAGETSVTYIVTNSCSAGSQIVLRFFDDQDGEVWPDAVNVYTLTAGMTGTFNLAPVTENAQTCYGAQTNPDTTGIFWGVGVLDNFSCTDCCNTVPSSGTATYNIALTPSATLGCEISIRPTGGPRVLHHPPTTKSVPQAPSGAEPAPLTPIPRRGR